MADVQSVLCIVHNGQKRYSIRTAQFCKKLGTPDLLNVALIANAQGKVKG